MKSLIQTWQAVTLTHVGYSENKNTRIAFIRGAYLQVWAREVCVFIHMELPTEIPTEDRHGSPGYPLKQRKEPVAGKAILTAKMVSRKYAAIDDTALEQGVVHCSFRFVTIQRFSSGGVSRWKQHRRRWHT